MNPESFFEPWERVVTNWKECLDEIGNVQELAGPNRELAWRGVTDATWALHSSIFRKFVKVNHTPPDEKDIVKYEEELLAISRVRWRFDNLSALETLAHIQHFGGPTRLLDVSFNPLVALWFAVEQKYDESDVPKADSDGRLFIFDATKRFIELDSKWGGRELPWKTRPDSEWRSGLPRVWRPPSYNERIPAQNSAFLIGGVPTVRKGGNGKYRKRPGDGASSGAWRVGEVRKSTSVTLSMNSLSRRPQENAKPTYTLRISASAKPAIRNMLEKNYGFNPSTIYPDFYGLAQYGYQGIPLSDGSGEATRV